MYSFAIILSMLVLAAPACRIPFLGGENGKNLFQDDFSASSSGWKPVTPSNLETGYVDGSYRIYVDRSGSDIWARPGLNFNDVRIEVDAAKIGGDDNNRFGIICRVTDWNHFYVLMISSDGYYGIGKIDGSKTQLLGMEALLPSEQIQKGNAINHIRADCVGDTLTLYANGEKLGEAQDSNYASGDVGLIAGTYDIAGTDILFDNFMVIKP